MKESLLFLFIGIGLSMDAFSLAVVYGTNDLEKKKFIESYWEVENGRRRKYYKITKKGVKELEVREQEWQLFSKTMGVVLRG